MFARQIQQLFIKNKNEKYVSPTLLGIMVFFYTVYFSLWTIARHNTYRFTSAYDLGFFDQTIWLISRGIRPYSTAIGHYFLGDHASIILFLVVPFYWIWDDVRMLLIFQSVILGMGAIPLYLLARQRINYRFVALAISASYLLYPALGNMNSYDFHPEIVATTSILFAFLFLERKQHGLFLGAVFITLLCKESISLTIVLLGIFVALQYNKRLGGIVAIGAFLWFLVATQVLIPSVEGVQAHSLDRWVQYGESLPQIAQTFLFHPIVVVRDIITGLNFIYLFQLFFPVAFLPFLDFKRLLIASGILVLNLTSNFPAQHTILYQYNAEIIPIIFVAMVFALDRLIQRRFLQKKHQKWIIYAISSGLIIISLMSSVVKIPSQLFSFSPEIFKVNSHTVAVEQCLTQIPASVAVSADTFIVPHISHRKEIYMFPNPFEFRYYYNPNDPLHTFSPIEYIIVDNVITNEQFAPIKLKESILTDLLNKKEYKILCERDGVLLLKRDTELSTN